MSYKVTMTLEHDGQEYALGTEFDGEAIFCNVARKLLDELRDACLRKVRELEVECDVKTTR